MLCRSQSDIALSNPASQFPLVVSHAEGVKGQSLRVAQRALGSRRMHRVHPNGVRLALCGVLALYPYLSSFITRVAPFQGAGEYRGSRNPGCAARPWALGSNRFAVGRSAATGAINRSSFNFPSSLASHASHLMSILQ